MAEERIKRRLTTILAADVAGYSRLAAEDEEATLRALKSYREIIDRLIARHDGRIFGAAGDSVVAEFGSAVEAVRAAIAIQEELRARNGDLPDDRRMDFRIGVNVGDVMVDGDNLYGDGVNVAARLEGLAEPGGICVSGSTFDQVKNRLSVGFEDIGLQSIKNIPDPVPTFRITGAPVSVAAPTSAWQRRRVPAIAAAALIVAAAVGGLAWWQPWSPEYEPASVERMRLPLPDKPSVAVLPFDNLSADPEQGFLADGITEDIITNLARLPGLFVVARNSTFAYKGKPVDVRTVAEDLGVRHIVEGSVRRSGDKIRVTAQLIDALSGQHIWADRYDRDVKNIFRLQDEIAKTVGGWLNKELMWTEGGHRTTQNLDAYHLVLKATQEFYKVNAAANARARQLAERAIELDPNYARAYAVLAYTYAFAVRWGWASDRKAEGKRAFELAQKAVAVDPGDFNAHQALGAVLHGMQKYDRSIAEYDKAIALNPNNADLLAASSNSLLYAGRFDDAIIRASTAMRLNPSYRWFYPTFLGRGYFGKGEFAKALPLFEESVRLDPRASVAIRYVAAIQGHLGNKVAAEAAVARLMELVPRASVTEMARQLGSKAVELPIYLEGLRKAGLRETAPADNAPPPLSIVVLPFDFLGAELGEAYLADVITDQLTTYLARIPDTFVIARNTAFTYKGKAVDVRQVGKDLGVRYVLEGSVQPAGDRLRVNAQLIDTESGAHMWAETFDHGAADRLQLQDEIVTRVARALQIRLSEVEAARLDHAKAANADAEALAIKCEAVFTAGRPFSKAWRESFKICEQVLHIDPNDARALSVLAIKHGSLVNTGQSADRAYDIKMATDFARRALAADPNYYLTHLAMSWAYSNLGRHEEVIVEAQRVLDLNPSAVIAYLNMCAAAMYVGKPEKAVEWAAKAMRVSPRDYFRFAYHSFTGRAYFMLGDYDRAIEWLRKSTALNPNFPQSRVHLAAALGYAGDKAEARKALDAYLALKRAKSRTIAQWKKELRTDNPAYVATFERLTEGLRKAGMPES